MRYCSKCQPKYDSEMWEEEDVFGICRKCGKACVKDLDMTKTHDKGINLLLSRALSLFRAA